MKRLLYILIIGLVLMGCGQQAVTFDQTDLEDCAEKFVEYADRRNDMANVYPVIMNPWPPGLPNEANWFDRESFIEHERRCGKKKKFPSARIDNIKYFDKFARVTVMTGQGKTLGIYFDYWIKDNGKWFRYYDEGVNYSDWFRTGGQPCFIERYILNINQFGWKSPELRDKTMAYEEETIRFLRMIVDYYRKEKDYPLDLIATLLTSNYPKVRHYCYEELKEFSKADGGIGDEFIKGDGAPMPLGSPKWVERWDRLLFPSDYEIPSHQKEE